MIDAPVTVAHVSVCKRCGAIGGASHEGSTIHQPPWHLCSNADDQRHWMVVVPVVVPIP